MRNPTGLTWEEHQYLGKKLRAIEALLLGFERDDEKRGTQLNSLFEKIVSELDELVELDCPDHPQNTRREIYIARAGTAPYFPTLDEISFSYAWDTLTELKARIIGSNPNGAVLKHIEACLIFIQKHDLCRIPANPEHLQAYQGLVSSSFAQTNK